MSTTLQTGKSAAGKQSPPEPAAAPPASPAPVADAPAPAAEEPVYAGDRYGLLFWLACAWLLIMLNVVDAFYHVLHR